MSLQASFQFMNIPASSTLVTSGNQNRKALHIQNKSGGSVYLRFGSAISAEQGVIIGLEIPANGDYVNDQFCPHDPVHLQGDDVAVGNNVVIMEVSEL